MPAPYTIEQTAKASGLSAKYIRRLKSGLPTLFEKHTERGKSNALHFDEEIVEVLKRIKQLKNRGRTLEQIREELAEVARKHYGPKNGSGIEGAGAEHPRQKNRDEELQAPEVTLRNGADLPFPLEFENQSLKRENELLRSQVTFLQGTVLRAEARLDRLLPVSTVSANPSQANPAQATSKEKPKSVRTQVLLWILEVTVFSAIAAGLFGVVWFFT